MSANIVSRPAPWVRRVADGWTVATTNWIGMSLATSVLDVTGLLTHQYETHRRRSRAEDGLRRVLVKVAATAIGGGRQRVK